MIGHKVNGEGNPFNHIIAVGEGPGYNEAQTGRPFVGLSGWELDRLFKRAAGIDRTYVYLTNIVKWRTDENDSDPTEEDIKRDEPELWAELEVVKPRIIISIGKISTSWFLGAEADMDRVHGLVLDCPKYPDAYLVPTYHPAAGLRQAERYAHLIYYDFEQVGRAIRGELRPIEDEFPNAVYEELG